MTRERQYRSIAGQKEYDEYVASKPPTSRRSELTRSHPHNPVIIERALRADLDILLSKVYLYYAILPYAKGCATVYPPGGTDNLAAVVLIGLSLFINVWIH